MTQPASPPAATPETVRLVMLGTVEDVSYIDAIVDEMLLDTGTGDRSKAFRQILRQHARFSGRTWPVLQNATASD